ncbi:pentatricopeptide repeat-containing protein At2g15980 [Vigna radiata var. radiata]|uniref:Pentatricopeptide repeat-containing protein At2g15980 n=1 Tax=Vigna radiata var. radiata TaxID=3916 RepID=A0A1S3VUJ0_VIGRR|nr:pentatricopeptide repeat-containing protein At2g15980 [Vigna radiata var. radiata]
MAIQVLEQFSQTLRPKAWALFFSSSCSNHDSQSLVTKVVTILINHRSKSRWSNLRSACPNGIDPHEFSQIILHLKNKPQLALRFFLWTKSKSLCHHNLASYASIVHLLARARLSSHAYHLIRTALRVSDQTHDLNCRFASPSLNLFETLVKTYRDSGSAPFVFDLLIKACLDSRKVDPSIEIVRMLLSRGISPKVSTLNSLITGVCRSRGVDAGYAIYREFFRLDEEKNEISRRGCGLRVTPNVHTYNELMLCCYQDGLVERIEEIWKEMRSNCKPNAYSYSVLMAAFCEEGKMGYAEKLWEEMRNEKMEPDVVSYNTIIGGFCKIGDVVRAEEFFREMELASVEATASTYEHLVKGYFSVGDVDSVVLVYEDMSRRDLRPDSSTLDMMVSLLCDKGRVQEALEFVRRAVSKFDLIPREKSYEVLIKGLCFEGRMEEALKLQAEMVGKGFQPKSEVYGAFVDGYIRQGNEEMARALRKEMLQNGIQS